MTGLLPYLWERRVEIAGLTGEHVLLVVAAIFLAVGIGVPTGVALTRRPRLAAVALGAASVVQTVPLRRRKDAPALSSPTNPSEPSRRPSTNHLKPTGTSYSLRPRLAVTKSIMLLETTVLPTAAPGPQSGRLENR